MSGRADLLCLPRMPKPSFPLHKKRYTVSFTVDITIPEITVDNAPAFIQNTVSNYQEVLTWPETWDAVAVQERFVQALLRPEHTAVLDRLLQHLALMEVWFMFGGEVASDEAFTSILTYVGIPDDLYAILSPVIATLDEEDQRWFQESAKNNAFYESIAYWYEAITADVNDVFVLDLGKQETTSPRNQHH